MKKIVKNNRKVLIIWMLTEVAFAAFMVIWSLIMSRAIEAGMACEFVKLRNILIVGFFYFVAMLVSFYCQAVVSSDYKGRCIRDLREELFSGIVNTNANKYSDYSSARFISIFNNDITDIVSNYYCGIPIIFAQLFLGLAATITLFFFSWELAIFEIIISLATSVIPVAIGKKSAEVKKEYMDNLGKYSGMIKDYISGAAVLKSFHVEGRVCEKHRNENESLRKIFMIQERDNAKIFAVITASRYMESALFLVFGAFLIATERLDVAMMIGAMQIAGYVENPVKQATRIYSNLQRTRLVMKGVDDFIRDMAEEPLDMERLITPLPLKVEHISFSYDHKKVLSDVSIMIEEGKKYAIIGESGSGKSTLVKILMRMLTDYSGTISAGEQEISKIDREDYVKAFSLISQDVVLFEDTIKNNITMYGKYDEEEIQKAIKEAGLTDFISKQEKGLETTINENGTNLSGGERQRITIARALLRKTSVLIMDEAISSLDSKTANEIEQTLLLNTSLTIISVTHKTTKNVLDQYDMVLRMEDGMLKKIESPAFN